MIAPKETRSSLRYPLDDILGSPGLVRLIRVLAYETKSPVSVANAAGMASLSLAGARKALKRLTDLGIAERVGTGRALKFSSKQGNPFLNLLMLLFEKENEHYQSLMITLRQIFTIPEVFGAWINELPLGIGVPLNVQVITDTKAIGWIKEELRSLIRPTERKYDLIIELAFYTRADKPVANDKAIFLSGLDHSRRSTLLPGGETQRSSEQRSLRLAKAIVHLINLDPSLVRRAFQYTNRLLHYDQGMATKDIVEWRQLLETYSVQRICDFLVSSSSRAIRLRRSMPFLAVLTHNERDKIVAYLESEQDEI